MRVLQVVSLLTPDGAFGGPARVALNQCAELVRRGHNVILAASTRGYPETLDDIEGVPVRLFCAQTLLPRTGFAGVTAPGLARWTSAQAAAFDVVHIHFARDLMVMPAAAITRRKRLPYVLQPHGMVIPSQHSLSAPLDALLTRRLLRDAKAVLYLTDLERRQLRDVARNELRFVQLANGVPTYPPASERSGPPEIVFVARLDARKRPMLFIAMAKKLLSEGVDARFALVGPDEGQATAVRAAIGDESRIRWEGPLDPAEIPRRLGSASVLVLPSAREPYPMSVLEAMSVGLPVVVCDDCGLAPAIDRTGSGVVTAGTAEALAEATKTVLSDLATFGRRARQTVRKDFGMTAVVDILEDVYERAKE